MKKILSITLALLMLATSIPFSAVSVGAVGDLSGNVDYAGCLPELPEGYHFTGDIKTDYMGTPYYFIMTDPSEYGLVDAYWIDISGRREDADISGHLVSGGTRNSALPASYDARNDGLVTGVEEQIGGTCWAHSSIACMEANAVKKGLASVDTLDLSEYYNAWHAKNGYYEGVADSRNDGRKLDDSSGVLEGGFAQEVERAVTNFTGPVSEKVYGFRSTTPDGIVSEMEDAFTYRDKTEYEFFVSGVREFTYSLDNVKEAVLEYGAAEIYYYSAGQYYANQSYTSDLPCAYYCPNQILHNHAVTVVGWDDDFSRENFSSAREKPSSDGAWLIKNSFGDDWGDDGFFWLSYEDATIANYATVFETESKDEYQNVYLYDGYGIWNSVRCDSAANIFTAKNDEMLTKVSTGVAANTYSFRIYSLGAGFTSPTDGTLLCEQSGDAGGEKYIDLDTPVALSQGTRFSVVFDGLTYIYGERESVAAGSNLIFSGNEGESFVKQNGVWFDTVREGTNNVCIRAVTKDLENAGSYNVTYECYKGGYSETVRSSGSVASLPAAVAGCTWVLTYGGEAFDGTGVNKNMTVRAHLYPTDGEKTLCITDYRCVYCGRKMKDSLAEHQYEPTVIEPSSTNLGYTLNTCSVCGDETVENVSFSNSAGYRLRFIYNDVNVYLQYTDKKTAVFCDGDVGYSYDFSSPFTASEELYINDRVTSLPDNFGATLTNVRKLVLPSSLTDTGVGLLTETAALSEIPVDENNDYYTVADGVLYSKDMKTLVRYPAAKEDVYFTVPASVETIAPYAFCRTQNLRYLDMSLCAAESLPAYAVYHAASMENINLPAGLSEIKTNAFSFEYAEGGAPAVIYVPSSVTRVEAGFINGEAAVCTDSAEAAVCSVSSAAVLPSHTHSYTTEKYSTAADCASPGERILACGCGAFIIDSYTAHHTKGEIVTVQEPYCLIPGYTVYVCSVCGEEFQDDEVAALEHDYEWVTDEAPTCVDAGVKHRECSRCGDRTDLNTPVSATGIHSYTLESVSADALKTAATCANDAEYYYSCSVCGRAEKNDGHTFTVEGTRLRHVSSEYITDVEPKCETGGHRYIECVNCHTVLSEETLGPAGHRYSDEVVDATCEAQGYTLHTCSACGDHYTDSFTNQLPHSLTVINARAASCDKEGYTGDEYCVLCKKIINSGSSVGKKPHTPEAMEDVAPTCTKAGSAGGTKCSVCNLIITEPQVIPAKGHTFGGWVIVAEPGCTTAGEQQRVCSVDGFVETQPIAATGHHDADSDGFCDDCRADLRQADDSGRCKYCGGKHEGAFGGLIRFFHNILYFFRTLFR